MFYKNKGLLNEIFWMCGPDWSWKSKVSYSKSQPQVNNGLLGREASEVFHPELHAIAIALKCSTSEYSLLLKSSYWITEKKKAKTELEASSLMARVHSARMSYGSHLGWITDHPQPQILEATIMNKLERYTQWYIGGMNQPLLN